MTHCISYTLAEQLLICEFFGAATVPQQNHRLW